MINRLRGLRFLIIAGFGNIILKAFDYILKYLPNAILIFMKRISLLISYIVNNLIIQLKTKKRFRRVDY